MRRKYTLVCMHYVGMGHYVVKLRRIKTSKLKTYVKKYEPTHVLLGWPLREGERKH